MTFHLHQDRLHRIARSFLFWLTRVLMSILTRWQVKGGENVPQQGPLLVVANHLGHADQYLIKVSLNRRLFFMAKESLFRYQPLRFLVESWDVFPVRRSGMDRKALRQADQILNSGLALVMFPEGRRSKNAQLQPALPGAALLAARNNVPILPVGIIGMEIAKKDPFFVLIHRFRVTLNIGRPFYLPVTDGELTKARLAELTDYIMEHIAALLPPQYQGHYAKRGNPSDTRD